MGQKARAQMPVDIDFTDLGSPLVGVQNATSDGFVTTGDFDGDGDPDLLLTGDGENGSTTIVYDNQDSDGTLTAGDLQMVGTDHDDLYDLRRSGVSSGDLDGDGNLEVLLVGQGSFEGTAQLESATIFEVLSDGTLTSDDFSVVADSTTSDLVGVDTGVVTKMTDLDGDGDLDLIINGRDASGSEITRVYENTDTNGAFGAGDISFVETGLPDGNVGTLSLGDLDKDGDPDLVVVGNGSVQIFENTSTGSLGPGTFVEVANTSNSDLIALDRPASALGDLDDDGDSDLVINGQDPNQSTRQLSLVYDNTDTDGDLTTDDFEEVRAPNGDRPLDGLTQGTLLLEDLDENGTLDILQSGLEVGNPVTEIYENEDANNTLEADDLSKRSNSLVGFQTGVTSTAADFNGDGDSDVLLNGSTQNLNRVAKIYRNLSKTGEECSLAWFLGVSGSDAAGNSITVTFGQSGAATAGIDLACGEEEEPPKPPSEIFDLRFTGTGLPGVDLGEGLVRDIRPTDQPTPAAAESAPATWRLEVQSENYPVTLTWDSGALASSLPNVPVRLVDAATGGNLVDVDMKSTGSLALNNSSVTALEIRLDRALTVEVPILEGWNLLSVPLEAENPSFGAVLPPCESGFFFETGLGYNGIAGGDPVPVGLGLFANCSAGTAQVTGQAPGPAIEVAQGWNIIGPLADSIAVESITSDPPGIVQTSFSGFDPGGGYQNASTLAPGKGYWVKAGESGTLDLSGSGGAAALASKVLASTPAASGAQSRPGAKLQFTDAAGRTATLRLAQDVSEQRLQRAALPPVPPSGIFDVRFEGGRSVAEASGDALRPIQTQGLKAPVTLELANASEGQSIQVRHAGETTRLTAESPSAKLSSTEDLAVGLQAAPEAFALKKTYPNPAGGRATVEYALPEQSGVTIAVYDVLGRRVATLADGREEAGRHTAVLDAGQLPSGTYFVRMRAEGFQQTRRLTVVQ
jgi:hypothetical protein